MPTRLIIVQTEWSSIYKFVDFQVVIIIVIVIVIVIVIGIGIVVFAMVVIIIIALLLWRKLEGIAVGRIMGEPSMRKSYNSPFVSKRK